jgi:hypothetical protein
MDIPFDPENRKKDLGKTWMLTNGTILSNIDPKTCKTLVKQVEFAHLYYLDVCNILEVDGDSGGMIIERQNSTLMMGSFVTEHETLISAEGEWVEGAIDSFDYCLARI